MVIISHSFKTLLSLLGFLTPQIHNFSILLPWNFFGLVPYPTYLFTFYCLELCRNYMSIIITIIGNNTVLVSHNLILFWFFMSMSHGVKKKRLLQVSPSSSIPPYQCFTRFICCFTRNTLSTFFCCDQVICERYFIFKENKIFPFSLLLVGFDFAVLLICVFYDFFFFHSSAIVKLRI